MTSALAPSPIFVLQLVAPHDYAFGSIAFTGVVTEREHDFDPISNTFSQVTTLYRTYYVPTTNNDGGGSLRQAIQDANASPQTPVAITFRIAEPSTTPWKTTRITTPLPVINGGIRNLVWDSSAR
jgi:hypothetical protein